MKITTDHPASRHGLPVILCGSGEVMDYAPGVRAVRKALGLTTATLGELCGRSGRTVEDWELGRTAPAAAALNVMMGLLEKEAGPGE